MRALVFGGNRTVRNIEMADPVPGPGEVVLEVKASGMCGSDLHYYRSASGAGGPVASGGGADAEPVIAGHAPCGVVAAVGPGVSPREARIGARVMAHHYWGCRAWRQVERHGHGAPGLDTRTVPGPDAGRFREVCQGDPGGEHQARRIVDAGSARGNTGGHGSTRVDASACGPPRPDVCRGAFRPVAAPDPRPHRRACASRPW